ncbi:exportin-1 [Pancytospora epiphaga]|nr:exportin-1 [Pancytospora epiphaga]
MEGILDFNTTFDVDLFDVVVGAALNSGSVKQREAEETLLKFKEHPGSWMKVDFILKNSKRKESKFIALQILEENVKSKWALFNDEMKVGLRQYVFTTVVERSAGEADIILNKLDSVLIEIAKREWPHKWNTFITDLIAVSKSTSMSIASNTLKILQNMNEQVFLAEEGITTTRKRVLQATLQQEYIHIFEFISLILQYSKTHDMKVSLVENCLNAFRSFCKSMPLGFIFSTEIVDHILTHLNSVHSIATLDCLLEIMELEKADNASVTPSSGASQMDFQGIASGKVVQIHTTLLEFFKMYLSKLSESEKLCSIYGHIPVQEQLFLKKCALVFAAIYERWLSALESDSAHNGLKCFVEISKIDDSAMFKIVFPVWSKLIAELRTEHPLNITPQQSLKKTGILCSILPVFVQNMPKPEEVFILVNDLGEVVRDRQLETAEIEFYKQMKNTVRELSCLIGEHAKKYFIHKAEGFINMRMVNDDLRTAYRSFNQTCWSIGALGGAFSEGEERNFFLAIMQSLLTLCEMRDRREERSIIASNIMFIIGQFHRFLKYSNEFMFVVLRKLFEFMGETCEGIKEMACDNFFKICERCPNQFFLRREGLLFVDTVISDLGSIAGDLDFSLQRVVLEGLLTVFKNGPKQDINYIRRIYGLITNQKMLEQGNIDSIPSLIGDHNYTMMVVHLVESYTLGYKILPTHFSEFASVDVFIYMFRQCAAVEGRNAVILKKSLSGLFVAVVESKPQNQALATEMCNHILSNFQVSNSPFLLHLATAVVENHLLAFQDASRTEIIMFFINSLISPAIPFVLKADEYIELTTNFLRLLLVLIKQFFDIFFPLLTVSPVMESLMSAVLFASGALSEVSNLALELLLSMYYACFNGRCYDFLKRFYLITLENLLGLVFDKDMKNSYDFQVELLFLLISQLNNIPPLGSGSNVVMFKEFILTLFTKNFKNITQISLNIFVEGLLEIKEIGLFRKHLDDFTVKIYEYGTDEDITAELELLKERVARSHY